MATLLAFTVLLPMIGVLALILTPGLDASGARRIALRVSDGGGALAVRISDDGCGFDLAEAERRRPGMGLFTMRERITLVGGQFDVVTSEGQGTSVLARIPVAGVGTN